MGPLEASGKWRASTLAVALTRVCRCAKPRAVCRCGWRLRGCEHRADTMRIRWSGAANIGPPWRHGRDTARHPGERPRRTCIHEAAMTTFDKREEGFEKKF